MITVDHNTIKDDECARLMSLSDACALTADEILDIQELASHSLTQLNDSCRLAMENPSQ